MKKLISIAVLAALGAVSQAQASVTVNINPDAGGADPVLSIGALDWTVGNALSVADAGQSVAAGGASAGQFFTTYAMAKLATLNDGLGNPVLLPSAYEWTFVAGFREQFTTVTGPGGAGTSAFNILGGAANATSNFFEIWYDAAKNGNALTGKGFQDGVRILSGHFVSGSGAFTADAGVTGGANIETLDQFGVNDYAGKTSLTGNGSSTGDIVVDSFDPTFFLSAPAGLTINFTSQQKLAFKQTNPSGCFWTGVAYMGGAGNVAEGCADTIGAINGLSGPNLILQADASNNFDGRVPEPGSLALLGLGFAAFGALRRKVAA